MRHHERGIQRTRFTSTSFLGFSLIALVLFTFASYRRPHGEHIELVHLPPTTGPGVEVTAQAVFGAQEITEPSTPQPLDEIPAQDAALIAAISEYQRVARIAQTRLQAREARRAFDAFRLQVALELAIASEQFVLDDPSLVSEGGRNVLVDALAFFSGTPTQLRHDGPVRGAAYSPDESRIVTWSEDGTASIWTSDGEAVAGLNHGGPVGGAGWNADGSRLVTWSEDGSLRIWDVSGRLLLELRHPGSVGGAVWNTDESRLATWADDQVFIWSADGELEQVLGHPDRVRGARWHGDGLEILTWSDDRTARVWDTSTGQPRLVLRHVAPVLDARWEASGSRIYTGTRSNVYAWNARTGEEEFWNELGYPTARMSPNGTRLLVLPNNGTVRVLDALTGRELYAFEDPAKGSRNALWSSDGRWLIASMQRGTLVVHAETGEVLQTLRDDPVNLRSFTIAGDTLLTDESEGIRTWDLANGEWISFTPFEGYGRGEGAATTTQADRLLTWGSDGAARIWNAGPSMASSIVTIPIVGRENPTLSQSTADAEALLVQLGDTVLVVEVASGDERIRLDHDEGVQFAGWNPDETEIMTVTYDDVIHLWDASAGNVDARIELNSGLTYAQWSPDGRRIAVITSDNQLSVWNSPSGAEVTLISLNRPYGRPQWSPDGQSLLAWSEDGGVSIWDVEGGELEAEMVHARYVTGALWSENGESILTWSGDGTARVWNAATGEERLRLRHGAGVRGAQWSADERHILTCSDDGTTRVWEAESGLEVLRLIHDGSVTEAIWNGDETRILTRSVDNTVRVWDAHTGEEKLRLPHSQSVTDVAWKDGDTLIFTASYGGSGGTLVRVWDAQSGDQLFTFGYGSTWLPQSDRVVRSVGGGIQVIALPQRATLERLINRANQVLTAHLPPAERETLFLAPIGTPTLVPTPRPTTTALPTRQSSTPLPSLTASATPLSTFTPTVLPSLTPVPAGQARIGQIEEGAVPLGGSQLWTFMGSEGDIISISVDAVLPFRNGRVSNQGGLDTTVEVIGPNQDILAVADDINPGVITDARIELLVLPATGAYQIRVAAFGGQSAGAYRLLIEQVGAIEVTPEVTPELVPDPPS